METEEQRSTQRWQRLRRAADMEELVVPAELHDDDDTWDRRRAQQHHADADAAAGGDDDDDDLEMRRDPMVRGWRWLKAVSMVVFTARPNKTTTTTTTNTEMEPLYPPQAPRSDDQSLMAAREVDIRLRSPHRRTYEVDVSKLNSPQRRTTTPTARVQPSLPPRQPAEFGNKNSVSSEVVMDVASPRTAQAGAVHGNNNPDDDKEERGRCLKYSQKALGFAVCTFIGYAANASTSTAFKMAIAPFFLAIFADLVSLKTKGNLGSAMVYFSSLHLVLMTYLIFIAFDMDHAYAILFLPVAVLASHFLQKLRPPPPPDAQSADDDDERSKAKNKELDGIFELSALILNWSSFVSAIMTVVRHFITDAGKNNDEIAPGAVGLMFFLTIILGIYLMLATTVRSTALNLPTKYLDVLLICLLLSTLIATVMTFSGANWKAKQQSPPAGGSS